MEEGCGKIFLNWPEAFNAGAMVAGGKGWNLGRLDRYGLFLRGELLVPKLINALSIRIT